MTYCAHQHFACHQQAWQRCCSGATVPVKDFVWKVKATLFFASLPGPIHGAVLPGSSEANTNVVLQDLLVSKISRKSIELLKKHFMDDMTRDDWRLVVKLKKTFQID